MNAAANYPTQADHLPGCSLEVGRVIPPYLLIPSIPVLDVQQGHGLERVLQRLNELRVYLSADVAGDRRVPC